MNVFKDLLPIFKKKVLVYENTIKEYSNIYTFNFKTKKPIKWMPGQHGIFVLKHEKIKKPIRPFSVASSPNEGIVKISVKIHDHPSAFKQTLLNLTKGNELIMRGPVGGFYLKDNQPVLFITGGIGVTPFRAIIKDLLIQSEKPNTKIDMLYIDSIQSYMYQDVFDDAKNKLDFNIEYLTETKVLHNKLVAYINDNQNKSKYFVTGSKSMVKSIVLILKENKVMSKNIIKDTFIGY